jgi:transketolase
MTGAYIDPDQIRAHSLRMVHQANASHIGSVLSMAEILSVLYGTILRHDPCQPDNPARDRFILSKGHACCGVYAVLALCGYFELDRLDEFGQPGSPFMTHISHKVKGVEFSTGSLGHGLPFGVGKAIAAKNLAADWRTFVLLSDGELNEGSNWEAFLLAPQLRLDNLVVIIDYNRIQSLGRTAEIMDLDPLAEKFRSFRWSVREVDGHNVEDLTRELSSVPWEVGKPSCLIAHTTKGKGVSFMEDTLLYHYKSPDQEQLSRALDEIADRQRTEVKA